MKNAKVSKVLLIFTFIISMLINLTPVYAANKKVKMPERAVDGSRIIYSYSYLGGYNSVSAVLDGRYIYYTTDLCCGSVDDKYRTFKRNIKTGQETGITSDNYENINIYKNILLGTELFGVETNESYVVKISKTGKTKKLALGESPIGIGNSIYYIGKKKAKMFYLGRYGLVCKSIGLYKMNVNGKRKELVKKGIFGWLGTSGKNLYYYNWNNKKWINVKTSKPERTVTLSRLYDIASKTKFTYNEKEVKAGKYENGKWKYKTILKCNKPSEYFPRICSVCVCGGKVLVLIAEGVDGGLYMMDLDGKNKTLLHKMQFYD